MTLETLSIVVKILEGGKYRIIETVSYGDVVYIIEKKVYKKTRYGKTKEEWMGVDPYGCANGWGFYFRSIDKAINIANKYISLDI